ncbi:right-handed parallel beta-helix repeat-containing protein [Aquimarina algiphila]|uniref:right-handed parallel beta-helix repeat-containing protein n=1 Tax=Aquimarina algiphila TaxID=2047982 RepID=UPI0023303B18|nr:right-handed parallel beta-helix repeat-containing protein [Aquimarina algiphila]
MILVFITSFGLTYFVISNYRFDAEIDQTQKITSQEVSEKPEKNLNTEIIIKEIEVSNFSELISNLGSHRTLIITDSIKITQGLIDNFNLLKWIPDPYDKEMAYLGLDSKYYQIKSSTNFSFAQRDTLSPKEILFKGDTYLRIINTEKLSLEGIPSKDIGITIDNDNSPVLGFKGNTNLFITNLNLVHTLPIGDDCGLYAPVLAFKEDLNVNINNCSLNGSGTEGIFAREVNVINVSESTIYNCSHNGIYLIDTEQCNITHSIFQNNKIDNHLFVLKNSNLNITSSLIAGNETWEGEFIHIYDEDKNDSSSFYFSDCTIKENKNFKMNTSMFKDFGASNSIQFSDFIQIEAEK